MFCDLGYILHLMFENIFSPLGERSKFIISEANSWDSGEGLSLPGPLRLASAVESCLDSGHVLLGILHLISQAKLERPSHVVPSAKYPELSLEQPAVLT